jgi:hypothetical protein
VNAYDGPFVPDFGLGRLSRAALAALGREYMLFGHLINRAALPLVHLRLGGATREAVAIDTWMGASPVYTRWMQQALGFAGDDVETIFKGLQLDVGFAHQYMDVRYALDAPDRGVFWLQSCGALLQVEPFGEGAVVSMCHHIEDPTFDATAVATHPRARCRPVHRPPRTPADRMPHCRWEVFVDAAAEPLPEPPLAAAMRTSRLARLAAPPLVDAEPGGWRDYAGPFDPDFQLEDLSHGALVRACTGFLLQDHLLVRSLAAALTARAGAEVAEDVVRGAWLGCAPAASRRVRDALGIPGDDAAAIAKVLQAHPAFLPGYAALRVEAPGPDRVRLAVADCDALAEAGPRGWGALLADRPEPALDAMAQAVNPRARVAAVTPRGDERGAWEIRIDPSAAPAPEPPEAAMVSGSGTAEFRFTRRRALRR